MILSLRNYIFVISSICIACNPKDSKGKDSSIIKDSRDHKKLIKIDSATHEDFDAFFTKFKKDSLFQNERKQIPLVVRYLSDDGVNFEKEEIKVHDFIYKFNEEKYVIDKVFIKPNSTLIQQTLDDSGISIDFYFNRHSNLWYLDSVIDSSW